MLIPFRLRQISTILSTALAVAAFCIVLAVYEAAVREVNRLAPAHQKDVMEIKLTTVELSEQLSRLAQQRLEGMNLFSPPIIVDILGTMGITATPLLISPEDIEQIREFSSVQSLAWQWHFNDPLIASTAPGNFFSIYGVPIQYFDLAGLNLSEGQIPTPEDCKTCLVLGAGARKILFGDHPVRGQQVTLELGWSEPFIIAGVLEPSPYYLADLNIFFDQKIYLLLPDTPQALVSPTMRSGTVETIWMKPRPGQAEQAVEEISAFFGEKYGNRVHVQFFSRQDYALVASGLNLQRVFLGSLLWTIGLAGATAAINVSGTAFQLLLQQRKHIGIRRSLGASCITLTLEFARHITGYALGGAVIGLVIAAPLSIFLGNALQSCGIYDCPPIPVRPSLLMLISGVGLSFGIWWLSTIFVIPFFLRNSPAALLRESSPTIAGARFKTLLGWAGFAASIAALLIILGLRDGARSQLDRILGWSGGERAGAFVSWITRYNQPEGNPQFLVAAHYRLLKKEYPHIQLGWLGVKGMQSAEILTASASMSEMRPPAMLAGRWFTREEEERAAKVAVLGPELARQIAAEGNVSPEMLVNQQWHDYTIIGIMDDWAAFHIMGYFDDVAYVPPGTPLAGGGEYIKGQIPFIVPQELDFQATIESMRQTLTSLQTINITNFTGKISPQYILPANEIGDILGWRMNLYRILGLFAGFSLFIGAVGVMNQVFAWVVSRWREIGIHRALGATRVDVARMVLAQALQITLLAALTGGAAGTLIALLVQFYSGWPLTVYPYWLAVALGVAAVAALLFGGLPAWWAASRAPTEMLRME